MKTETGETVYLVKQYEPPIQQLSGATALVLFLACVIAATLMIMSGNKALRDKR